MTAVSAFKLQKLYGPLFQAHCDADPSHVAFGYIGADWVGVC